MRIAIAHHELLWRRGGLWIVENTEHQTYTLYETVDTMMHPSDAAADAQEGEPYYYDTTHGVMYILKEVASGPDNDVEILVREMVTL